MKQIIILTLIVFVVVLCSASVVDASAELPDSSGDGGLTGNTEPVTITPMVVLDPSNEGGYTPQAQETSFDDYAGPANKAVHRQETDSNQAVTGGSSWETPEGSYLTQRPEDYGKLIETGALPGSNIQATADEDTNSLWIVDLAGFNRYPEITIPINGYVREEVIPSVGGQITIEDTCPDSTVRIYGMGYVKPYCVYKMWFYGDIPGTHTIRYSINGTYSNIIRFYVQGSQSQGASISEASSGSTTSIGGDKNFITGGSTGSSSFSSSATDGSNQDETMNRAIAFCVERGNIYKNGTCTFPGGSSCDVWDFYSGDCILAGKPRR